MTGVQTCALPIWWRGGVEYRVLRVSTRGAFTHSYCLYVSFDLKVEPLSQRPECIGHSINLGRVIQIHNPLNALRGRLEPSRQLCSRDVLSKHLIKQEHLGAQKLGDIIACPPGGPETAHQILNTGNEELRYLAVSTKPSPEICDYPDSGKFGVLAEYLDRLSQAVKPPLVAR